MNTKQEQDQCQTHGDDCWVRGGCVPVEPKEESDALGRVRKLADNMQRILDMKKEENK